MEKFGKNWSEFQVIQCKESWRISKRVGKNATTHGFPWALRNPFCHRRARFVLAQCSRLYWSYTDRISITATSGYWRSGFSCFAVRKTDMTSPKAIFGSLNNSSPDPEWIMIPRPELTACSLLSSSPSNGTLRPLTQTSFLRCGKVRANLWILRCYELAKYFLEEEKSRGWNMSRGN